MTTDLADTLERLELFNEQVDVLVNSDFSKRVLGNEISVTLEGERDASGRMVTTVSTNFPDDEMLRAFVLTYRFFVQNNESISIGNIGELYDNLPIAAEFKNRYRHLRKMVNEALDSLTEIKFKDCQLSKRDIYDTYLYGTAAHLRRDKRMQWKEWMSIPFLGQMAMLNVIETFGAMVNGLRYFQRLNMEVLEALRR